MDFPYRLLLDVGSLQYNGAAKPSRLRLKSFSLIRAARHTGSGAWKA